MRVAVTGKIQVYSRDGAYQLYCTSMVPTGIGDLFVAFEQLKAKLAAEGLFDPAHKKPLPPFPRRIAVVTSPSGAAVQDILTVLNVRWPLSQVLILPVLVQGAEAPVDIAGAIRYANALHLADLIITGRGGGSMEDLWAFNDERVVRAIYASDIPVISAVGHEPDVTLSDFAADLRAATPTNAAELAVPDQNDVRAALLDRQARLSHAARIQLQHRRALLNTFAQRRVLNDPSDYISMKHLDLDRMQNQLADAYSERIGDFRHTLANKAAALDAMSPLRVLSRGYAVALSQTGKTLRSVQDVHAGETIAVRLQDGMLGCTVNTKENPDG